jgi:hypothetical protein
MQDNKRIKNDELIEAGWAQMQTILDKEMPVKKDKRRILLWLFLVLFAVSAGAFTIKSLNSVKELNKPANIVAETNPEKIKIVTEGSISNQEDESSPTQETSTDNFSNEKEYPKKGSSDLEDVDHENTGQFNKSLTTNITIGKTQESINTNSNVNDGSKNENLANVQPESHPAEDMAEVNITSNNSTIHKVEESINKDEMDPNEAISIVVTQDEADLDNSVKGNLIRKKEELSPLSPLSGLNSVVLIPVFFEYLPFDFSDHSAQKTFVDRSDKKFSIGLYAGLLSSDKLLSNGFQVGVDADIRVSKLVGISTSLGFTRITKNESESLGLDAAQVVEDPETLDFMTYVINTDITNDILNTRNYLDFSVKPKFWLTPYLTIASGPSLAYLLSAKNEASSRNEINLSSTFLTEEKLINAIDFSLNTEIRYQINRRFGISILYNHGLISLWKKSSNLDSRIFSPALNATKLIYENTGSNFNRFVGLRAHFVF